MGGEKAGVGGDTRLSGRLTQGAAVGQALAEGDPRGLSGDVDGVGGAGFRFGEFGGGEDGEEDEGFVVGVVGAVDGAGGDVGHFTCGKEAFFFAHPLFGAAIEDVDDFFPMGVVVERVAVAWGHVGADEEELFCVDEIGTAEPFVVGPGVDFADGVVDFDEAIGGGVGHGKRRAARRGACN